MEGANEAARRAVNAILDRTGSRASRCKVFELPEPAVLRPARMIDELRWRLGHRPAKPRLRVAGKGDLEPAGLRSRALLEIGSLTRRLRR
jgi:hypothetical protein